MKNNTINVTLDKDSVLAICNPHGCPVKAVIMDSLMDHIGGMVSVPLTEDSVKSMLDGKNNPVRFQIVEGIFSTIPNKDWKLAVLRQLEVEFGGISRNNMIPMVKQVRTYAKRYGVAEIESLRGAKLFVDSAINGDLARELMG